MKELDIKTLSFEEAWEIFSLEVDLLDSVCQDVRFGVAIRFDIYHHINGYVQIKPKSEEVLIAGRMIPMADYHTELMLRERKMKEWLLENFGEKDFRKSIYGIQSEEEIEYGR